jgi:hypothetical protein
VKEDSRLEADMKRPRQNVIAGTILIRKGTELPSGLHVETTEYSHDWEAVDDSDNLDVLLRRAGWNLFFIAGALRSISLGTGELSMRKGVSRLLKQIRPLYLNSMRVTHIANKTFLGIRYQVLFAHPSHIQQSRFLAATEARKNSISQLTIQLTPSQLLAVPASR